MTKSIRQLGANGETDARRHAHPVPATKKFQTEQLIEALLHDDLDQALPVQDEFEAPSLNREKEYEPVPVPRSTLPRKRLEDVFNLPEFILKKLPKVPDHTDEARSECVRLFLQDVLLPRLAAGEEIDGETLEFLALQHKREFRAKHPNDLVGEFYLISAVEVSLTMLDLHYRSRATVRGTRSLTGKLVPRALRLIRSHMHTHTEKLYWI